jgi:hypothetical protein
MKTLCYLLTESQLDRVADVKNISRLRIFYGYVEDLAPVYVIFISCDPRTHTLISLL